MEAPLGFGSSRARHWARWTCAGLLVLALGCVPLVLAGVPNRLGSCVDVTECSVPAWRTTGGVMIVLGAMAGATAVLFLVVIGIPLWWAARRDRCR